MLKYVSMLCGNLKIITKCIVGYMVVYMINFIPVLNVQSRTCLNADILNGYTYFMWCHHVWAIFSSETLQSAGSICPPRIAP
jgi:hypothetical protein